MTDHTEIWLNENEYNNPGDDTNLFLLLTPLNHAINL